MPEEIDSQVLDPEPDELEPEVVPGTSADDPEQPDPDATDMGDTAETGEDDAGGEPEPEKGPVPYSRFDQVNRARKAQEEALAEAGFRFDSETGKVVPLQPQAQAQAQPAAEQPQPEKAPEGPPLEEQMAALAQWDDLAAYPATQIVDESGFVVDEARWSLIEAYGNSPAMQRRGWTPQVVEQAKGNPALFAQLRELMARDTARDMAAVQGEIQRRDATRWQTGAEAVRARVGAVEAPEPVAQFLKAQADRMLSSGSHPQAVQAAMDLLLEAVNIGSGQAPSPTSTPQQAPGNGRLRGVRQVTNGQAPPPSNGRPATGPRVTERERQITSAFGNNDAAVAAELERIRGKA